MHSNYTGNMDINFLLKKLDNHIQRYLHSFYKRKDFQDCSLTNMWVADFLFDNQEKNIYQKDIEAEFSISKATASKMLLLMEEKQLIQRVTSEEDARLKKIELLPKGYDLHLMCTIARGEIENKLTKTLSPEEVDVFKALCKKMITNMEK